MATKEKITSDIVFDDNGSVKYNRSGCNNVEEAGPYLYELDSNTFSYDSTTKLKYDENSNKFMLYETRFYDDKEFYHEQEIKFNKEQLEEFYNNNTDSIFNEIIRRSLKQTEEKERYEKIDSEGKFDNFEDADFYVRYLYNQEILDEDTSKKLNEAKEYIFNNAPLDSDVYNNFVELEFQRLDKSIKSHRSIRNEAIRNMIIKTFVGLIAVSASLNFLHIIFTVIIALFFLVIMIPDMVDLSIFGESLKNLKNDKQEFNDRVLDNELKTYNNTVNKEKEKINNLEETNTNINTNNNDFIRNAIICDIKNINSIISNDTVLPSDEKFKLLEEASSIIEEYSKRYDAIKNKDDDIVLTMDNEAMLQRDIFTKIQRLKNKINNKIDSVSESNHFDEDIEELSNLLNSTKEKHNLVKTLSK